MRTAAIAISIISPSPLTPSTHQGHGPPHHHQLIHDPQGSTHASPRLQAKLPAQAARRTETKPKGTVCTAAGVKVSAVHTSRPQPTQSPRRLQNAGGHNGHCAR